LFTIFALKSLAFAENCVKLHYVVTVLCLVRLQGSVRTHDK